MTELNKPTPWRLETKQEVRTRQQELIDALLKSKSTRAPRLAKRLRSCSRPNPCNTAVCPTCVRDLRLRYMAGVSADLSNHAKLSRISVIPKGGRVPIEELEGFDFGKWRLSVRKNLERKASKLGWVLAGVD